MKRDCEEEETYDVQRHNKTPESRDYAAEAVASAIGKKNDKENLVTRILRRSAQSFRRLSSTDKSTEKPKKNLKGPMANDLSSANLPLPKLLTDSKRLSASTKSLNIFPTETGRCDRIKSHLNVPQVATSELRKWRSTGKLYEKVKDSVIQKIPASKPTNFSKPRNATFIKKPVKNFVHANKSTASMQKSKPSTFKTQHEESNLRTNLKPVNKKLGGSSKSLNSENVEENKKKTNRGSTNLRSSFRWPTKPSEIKNKLSQTKPIPYSRKTIVLNKKPPPPHNQLQVSTEKVSSPKPKPVRPRPASQIPLLSSNVAEQDGRKTINLASLEPAEAINPLHGELQELRVKVDMLTNENLNLKEVVEAIQVSNQKVLTEIQTATDAYIQKVDEERKAWKILNGSEKENFTLMMKKFKDFEEKVAVMKDEVKEIKSNLNENKQAKSKVKPPGEEGKLNEIEEKIENFNDGKEKLMNRIRGINARMSSSGIGMKEMMERKSCNEQLLTSELEKIQVSVTQNHKPRNSRKSMPCVSTIQDISEPDAGGVGNQFR